MTPFQISPPNHANALLGAAGHVVVRPEGLYYTHRSGGRIYFEPPGGGRTVLVGTGETGTSPDGTSALEAKLNHPEGLAVDAGGNIYFTEWGNHLVRVVPRSNTVLAGRALEAGRIYTVAGNGIQGFSGDGGPATAASMNMPSAVVLGERGGLLLGGTLLVSDAENGRIREVANDGTIATVIGGGSSHLSNEGTPARAYGGGVDYQLARDAAGNLAFSRSAQVIFYCRVGGRYFGRMMSAGHLYRVAGTGEIGFDGDGPATSVRIWAPRGLVFDVGGNLYFCDEGTKGIRGVTVNGQLRWLAGVATASGAGDTSLIAAVSPATSVPIRPYSLAIRDDGALLLGDGARLRFDVLELRGPWSPHSQ
ncbi:NHL repeat protein [compost metagenome]